MKRLLSVLLGLCGMVGLLILSGCGGGSSSTSTPITPTTDTCGSGNESVLNGQYAFTLSGYNSSGFLAAIGSFTADGSGHITAGTVDSNGALGVQSNIGITTSGSSYSVGSDYRGCATIATPFKTFTVRFALDAVSTPSHGFLEEWDSGSTAYIASGNIQRQYSISSPSGVWVFQDKGVNGSSDRAGAIGGLTFGSSNAITGGEYDDNITGTRTNIGAPISGGSYSSLDSTTGRFTITTTLNGVSYGRVAYMVLNSYDYVELTTAAPSSTTSVLLGAGKQQSTPALSGNIVYYASGLKNSSGFAEFGQVTANGTSFTLRDYQDNAGTWTNTDTSSTCNYTLDGYGRMTSSGAGCGTNPVLFYVTGTNRGFLLGTNAVVALGQFENQESTSVLTLANLSYYPYSFGTQEIVNRNAMTAVGAMQISSSGVTSGKTDFTSLSYPRQGSQSISGTITIGSYGTFTSSGYPTVNPIGIVVREGEVIFVNDPTGTYPTITAIIYLTNQ